MADMSTYLSTKVADYSTTELSVTPQNVMIEEGLKNQIIHEFDDGTYDVVTMSPSYFTISIQWDWLSISDASTILDFYHDATKANGMARTFYWQNPLDSNTYVVRFITSLRRTDTTSKPNAKEISGVMLRVEGVKAS